MATHFAIYNEPKCAGGTVLARALNVDPATWWEDVAAAGEVGGGMLFVAVDAPELQLLAMANVVRITDELPDGTVRKQQWRTTGLEEGTGSPVVGVRLTPAGHFDLGRYPVRATVGGVTSFAVVVTGLTLAQIIAQLALPSLALDGVTHYVAGTIDVTTPLTFTMPRATVLELLQQAAAQAKCEFWVDENADTSFTLNFGKRNATAIEQRYHVGVNADALDGDIDLNDRFFNRATAFGATLSGESAETHLGQQAWRVSSVVGTQVQFVDPETSEGPIRFTDQLNGKYLRGWSRPLAHPIPTSGGLTTADSRTVAFDSVNRRLWWTAAGKLYYMSLVDGTSAELALAVGLSTARHVYFDAARTRIMCYCNSGHVQFVSSALSTASYWSGLSPGAAFMSYLPAMDAVVLGFDNGSTDAVVYALASGATVCTLAQSGVNGFCKFWSTASVITGLGLASTPGHAQWNTSGALITGNVYVSVFGQPTYDCVVTASYFYFLNGIGTVYRKVVNSPATATVEVTPAAAGGIAMAPANNAWIARAGNGTTHYFVGQSGEPTGRRVFGYDPTTNEAVQTMTPLTMPDTALAAIYEASPARLHVLTLTHVITYSLATPSAPALTWAAQILDSAPDWTVILAANSYPWDVGMHVEVRNNASLDYLVTLDEPASVQAYGPFHGKHEQAVLAKGNYAAAAGLMAEWGTDDRAARVRTNLARDHATRWRVADRSGVSSFTATLAATFSGGTSMQLSGAGASRVISPGDIILAGTPTTPVTAVNNFVVVRQRTVANGAGAVTLPVTAGGFALASGNTVTVFTWQGSVDTPSAVVAYPPDGATLGPVVVCAHAPYLSGDTTAQLIVTVDVRLLSSSSSHTLTLTGVAPSGTPGTTAPVALPAGDGSYLTRTLSIPVTLTSDGLVQATLALTGSFPRAVVMVRRVMLTLGASPVLDQAILASGAHPMWHATNDTLEFKCSPARAFAVQITESDAARPVVVGGFALLKHPARRIANARVRVVRVRYAPTMRGRRYRHPVVTLDSNPESVVQNIVALESA